MIDFNKLRQTRGNNTAALQRSLEKTEGGYQEDPRIWKYTRNAEKNISVNTIRLLPIGAADFKLVEEGRFKEEDLTPMVKILKHQFQGPKGWLVSNSPQTFGEDDPISEWSRPQWAAIKGKDKEDPVVKAERERLKEFIPSSEYYANILVIKDAQKPEFNGQVKLFKFGEAFRKFIDTASNPQFDNEVKFDPFDMWDGANIELNLTFEARKFKGRDSFVPKWEKVKWADRAPLGDEDFMQEIWNKQHSLLEFLDRKNFMSYDDLKAKFHKVMGMDENGNPTAPGSTLGKTAGQFLEQKPAAAAAPVAASAPAPAAAASAPAATPAPAAGGDELAALEALLAG
jgi:hypothetical protein